MVSKFGEEALSSSFTSRPQKQKQHLPQVSEEIQGEDAAIDEGIT